MEPATAFNIYDKRMAQEREQVAKRALCRQCRHSSITRTRHGDEVGYCTEYDEWLTQGELDSSIYEMECAEVYQL